MDTPHRGAVEYELFKDVVLRAWTPRSGDSGECFEREGAMGHVHVVDDELEELLGE